MDKYAKEEVEELKKIKVKTEWRTIGIAASFIAMILAATLVWQNLPKAINTNPLSIQTKVFESHKTLSLAKKDNKTSINQPSKNKSPRTYTNAKSFKQNAVSKKQESGELMAFAENKTLDKYLRFKDDLPESLVVPKHIQEFKVSDGVWFENNESTNSKKVRFKILTNKAKRVNKFSLKGGEKRLLKLAPGRYYLEVRLKSGVVFRSFIVKK